MHLLTREHPISDFLKALIVTEVPRKPNIFDRNGFVRAGVT